MKAMRMNIQSCLNENYENLFLDTSAIISLCASGFFERIAAALPNRFLVSSVVVNELHSGKNSGRSDWAMLDRLVQDALIGVHDLAQLKESHFLSLVGGDSAETLDDGEAATIASALECYGVAVLDERKARRICQQRFPSLHVASAVDVLAHRQASSVLGTIDLKAAIFKSLKFGRMRVPNEHVAAIVDLLGPDQIAQCPSLPRSVRF